MLASAQITDEEYFLSTYFQTKIEESEYYSNLPSEESRPYDNKYKARKILEALLIAKNIEDLSPDNRAITKGIIEYLLALNFFDTEENSLADKHFLISLELFTQIKKDKIVHFFNYIQDLYNSLGIIYTNREDIQNGLGIFAKAEALYNFMKKIYNTNQVSIINNMKHFRPSNDTSKTKFQFYHQGGINISRCEKSYTLTLFYMAQAYAKIGLKFKAAQYCGWTLKRQLETNDYELRDWSINCLSMAEFYNANFEFAQAQYLLMAGISILPEDSKKKLHATYYMALGHHLLEYLGYSVEKFLGSQQEEPLVLEMLNKETITFTNLKTEFPKLKLPKNPEEFSSIFRQMNTQFKKALKHYELDGYVTEYVQIVRDLSKGYRYLMLIEQDAERILALLDRRRELLEYPANEINPKAYELYWQQLCLELGEIYNQMFEFKYQRYATTQEKPKKSTIEILNKYCMASIDNFEKVIQSVTHASNKEALDNQETLKTIITAKFNVAKNYSRLQFKDSKETVNTLKRSMESYKWIKDFINEHVAPKGTLNYEMRETLKNCEEMVQLLPSKIDRVHYEGS